MSENIRFDVFVMFGNLCFLVLVSIPFCFLLSSMLIVKLGVLFLALIVLEISHNIIVLGLGAHACPSWNASVITKR